LEQARVEEEGAEEVRLKNLDKAVAFNYVRQRLARREKY
jgi:hypothetical protein